MADKYYTVVAALKVDKIFDNKYKSSLAKVMKKAAEAGIANSKSGLTNKKPSEKDAKTYSLDITVSSLTLVGDVLELNVKIPVSEDDNFAGAAAGHSKLPSKNPKERDDDVEALVEGVVRDTVIKSVANIITGFISKNR